jgi:hypothetical protein
MTNVVFQVALVIRRDRGNQDFAMVKVVRDKVENSSKIQIFLRNIQQQCASNYDELIHAESCEHPKLHIQKVAIRH